MKRITVTVLVSGKVQEVGYSLTPKGVKDISNSRSELENRKRVVTIAKNFMLTGINLTLSD